MGILLKHLYDIIKLYHKKLSPPKQKGCAEVSHHVDEEEQLPALEVFFEHIYTHTLTLTLT